MRQPKLLDLFCGAGGAGAGYARCGFEVIGVDLKPQPRYPFAFVQGDALAYLAEHGSEFDAIHASPPCQRFSAMTKRWRGKSTAHLDLIGPVRTILERLGKPFIIENVEGARDMLRNPVTLCGSMFDLDCPPGYYLRRHRLFECHGFHVGDLPHCEHAGQAISICGHGGGRSKRDGLSFLKCADWGKVMEIDWMTQAELAQAIPPAYTHWLGQEMLAAIPE